MISYQEEERMAENEELKRQQVKKVLRRRKWSYRFVATLLILLAVRICIAGNWEEIPVSIATVVQQKINN